MILFSCVVLAFFIGNVWSINITQSVKISVLDIVIVVGLISQMGQIRQMVISLKPIGYFVLICSLSLLLALKLFPVWQVGIGSLYLLRFVAYFVFFASNVWGLKLDQTDSILHALGVSLLVAGIGQYVLYPDIRFLSYLQWDDHLYRVVGTFLDPGFTSVLLVLYLVFLLCKPVKNKGLQWLLVVADYLLLALTYSRSGYIAWLAAAAFLAWKVKGWKFFVAAVALLVVTVMLLPRAPDGEGVKLERQSSIYARITSWKNAGLIVGKNPVLGVGFNNYRYAQNKYGLLTDAKWQISHAGAGADSSLLFVAATTGVVGLFFYLAYVRQLYRQGDLVLQASLATLLVHSIFLNSLFYPAVLAWLGLLTVRARLITGSKLH